MVLKDFEIARREANAVQCRPDPIRVSWKFADLIAADSHSLDCRFSCSIRLADTPADRRMFFELFLSNGDSVTSQTVVDHFAGVIRRALARVASECKASDIVRGSDNVTWIRAATEAAKPIAFAAGLELLPPFQFELESSTLQHQRLAELNNARAEEFAVGQLKSMERASELLRRFEDIRQAAPSLSAARLLEKFSPADQGLALQNLLRASAARQHTIIWAVGGTYLVRIDPRSAPAKTQLFELPDTVGPMRSVQPALIEGNEVLLIGASRGVIQYSLKEGAAQSIFQVSPLDSQLGFNRVIFDGKRIWASHGDAGIVAWELEGKDQPVAQYLETSSSWPTPEAGSDSISPGSANHGARCLNMLDESRLIYAIGNTLVIRRQESRTIVAPQDVSAIVAVVAMSKVIVAVHQSGTLLILDSATEQVVNVQRRGNRIAAAAAIPWLGDQRILLATDDGPVNCIGLDDPLATEYLSGHRGLKMIEAAADLVVGVSPDRQRIIVWNSWDGQRPVGEIHLTSQTRHRIADIALEAVFEAN